MLQDLKTMSHKKLFLYGYFLGYSVGLLLSMSLSVLYRRLHQCIDNHPLFDICIFLVFALPKA